MPRVGLVRRKYSNVNLAYAGPIWREECRPYQPLASARSAGAYKAPDKPFGVTNQSQSAVMLKRLGANVREMD